MEAISPLSTEECDIDTRNTDGESFLHIACKNRHLNCVKTLAIFYRYYDFQNTKDAKNSFGDTALHLACYGKSIDIIRLLIEMRCSTIIPNKKSKTAQDIPLNEDGDYLLHIACQWGDVDIVRYLITDERCNPSIQSCISKNTPLHIAAKYGQDDTIVQLFSYKECDPNAQNRGGDTPLHLAVRQNKTSAISHLLANKQCNSYVQNKKGDTPLHFAVRQSKTAAISKLLAHQQCSIHVQNNVGDTSLHIAAKYGQEDAIDELFSCKECDPNAQNKEGDTPLHIAVRHNKTAAISKLLAHQECNPNVQNKKGNTPLHIACWKRSLNITKVLLGSKCSTNIRNKKGETAQDIPLNEDGDCLLHIACHWGDVDIVRYLINDERCNPNLQSFTTENTPLHIAVRDNRAHVISQLLANEPCNLNIWNNVYLTPLLIAINHKNSSAATALLQHRNCDPTLCDPHGNTPLHLACIGGETEPEMVKVAKLLLTSVDPSCVNNAGQTPIELTTNYQLIQAISHFVKCKTKQSVQTYINILIVGNPETGKSTLVKAICKEASSILWKFVPKQARRVKNVPLHTAGIIPTTFQSKAFGNTVLYDLAGQVEYYTSHAAVIQSTVISTPPAFVIVVNLSESEEKISQTLRYWWSFIDNHAARCSAPPQVILVGSHADIVKSAGKSVKEKMTHISVLLKKLPAAFHFAGQVALDSRDPASRKLQHFCSLVNQSCTVLRKKADVDLRCHVLYAFLLDRFNGKVACTVSDVATSVKENRELLPQNPDSLIPLISTLSDKGLLLLVKGGETHGGWWVILQKHALLSEVNGAIFAPENFSQHKDLSWSTGVVPFSKLKTEFPKYNPNMVTGFLTHLEFCFKIEDHETLALLKDEASNVKDISPNVSEEYYFFPALVSVENPLDIWEKNDNMCCKCGWLYKCIRHDQFLTTQFLHVLILRLAFTFALKLDPGDCCEELLALRRKCSVWKHGIGWLNETPIETVVEVGLQYQSVIVMMRCPKGKEAKCIQLCSEIIQKLVQVKNEHCKAVEMCESFIHPTNVKYPFSDNIEDVKFYSLNAIARVIVKREENVLDQRGRNPTPVQDLLLFDPYSSDTSTELLRELFGRTHTMDETVRRRVLKTLNSECRKVQDYTWPLCITQ